MQTCAKSVFRFVSTSRFNYGLIYNRSSRYVPPCTNLLSSLAQVDDSLRKNFRQFILRVHPDRLESQSSAQKLNEQSIKKLNALMDCITVGSTRELEAHLSDEGSRRLDFYVQSPSGDLDRINVTFPTSGSYMVLERLNELFRLAGIEIQDEHTSVGGRTHPLKKRPPQLPVVEFFKDNGDRAKSLTLQILQDESEVNHLRHRFRLKTGVRVTFVGVPREDKKRLLEEFISVVTCLYEVGEEPRCHGSADAKEFRQAMELACLVPGPAHVLNGMTVMIGKESTIRPAGIIELSCVDIGGWRDHLRLSSILQCRSIMLARNTVSQAETSAAQALGLVAVCAASIDVERSPLYADFLRRCHAAAARLGRGQRPPSSHVRSKPPAVGSDPSIAADNLVSGTPPNGGKNLFEKEINEDPHFACEGHESARAVDNGSFRSKIRDWFSRDQHHKHIPSGRVSVVRDSPQERKFETHRRSPDPFTGDEAGPVQGDTWPVTLVVSDSDKDNVGDRFSGEAVVVVKVRDSPARIADTIKKRAPECVKEAHVRTKRAQMRQSLVLKTRKRLRSLSLDCDASISEEKLLRCSQRLYELAGHILPYSEGLVVRVSDRFEVREDGVIFVPWDI
eukprot:Rmarinus@m.9690